MRNVGSPHIEQRLFQQINEGNEQAFRALFDLYRVRLYHMALKLTKSASASEDIIQDVFTGLWISRMQLAQVEDPGGYIFRALFNRVSQYLKKESNRERILRDALRFSEAVSYATEQTIDAHQSQRLVELAVESLPPQQRSVYKLSRMDGLNNEEIAHMLHISTHTVKSHLAKALASIKVHLKQEAVLLAFIILAESQK